MDAKTVYLSNGKPFLVMKNSENEFIYPDAKYTEIEPPKDLYFTEEYPLNFNFETNEWHGLSELEYIDLKAREEQPQTPNETDVKVSKLQLQLSMASIANSKLASELQVNKEKTDKLEQNIAALLLKMTELEKVAKVNE